MNKMEIVKRNGSTMEFNPSKILTRIKKQSEGLKVNPDELFIKVTQGIGDGITTSQIDDLIAITADSLSHKHPDYSKLAANIFISRLHKETEENYFKLIKRLKNNGIVNESLYNKVKENFEVIQKTIDYSRDYMFDYFACSRLKEIYLLKERDEIVERPQHMYMRVALTVTETIEDAIKYYNLVSTHKISPATPISINGGTNDQSMISCNLTMSKGDNTPDLLQTLANISISSSRAEGIGLALHNIRSKESYVGKGGGKAGGLLKYMKVVNESLRFWNQKGKRPGAAAVYLEPWHKDVADLIEIRKEGADELRARDMFAALWIPDNFMRAVESDGDWYLFCPNDLLKNGIKPLWEVYGEEYEEEYNKAVGLGIGNKIKAQSLWKKILEAQIETGVPYMAYKDHVNHKSNQQNIGTIKSSNLCVAPETLLLTDNGYIPIGENEGKIVNVWNGEEFSETAIVKTGENQKLIKVNFSNGSIIECTEYHKFYVQEGYVGGTSKNKLVIKEVRAIDLKPGQKIVKYVTPIIEFENEMADAYTQGFFSGDGCTYKGKNHIDLYGVKLELKQYLTHSNIGTYNEKCNKQRIKVSDEYVKFEVPLNYSIKSKIEWLEGLSDSDGTLCRNGKTQSLQISSIHLEFLNELMLMLQTLGVQSKLNLMSVEGDRLLPDGKGSSKLYYCKPSYRVLIGAAGLKQLQNLGFSPKRLNFEISDPNRNAEQFVKVISVEDEGRISDTYCVNEPKRNKVIFNGILTGNCAEINLYSDAETTAQCVLSSLVLQKFVNNKTYDFKGLYDATYEVVKSLNVLIDVNDFSTEEAKKGATEQRALAIGVQGLADTFALMGYPFTSEEAKKLNKDIFETIYYASLKSSCDLAKEKNDTYKFFKDSPFSKGILQYDMWNITELSGLWDWNSLKADIVKYGVMNSTLTSTMPTASSASIIGSTEAIEPFFSNMYVRKVIGGEHTVINKYLINDLEELGLWNDYIKAEIINNDGSIQDINVIPQEIREKYKTVYEISQKELINMSAERAPFIDQSQSLNIFMKNPTVGKLTSSHFHGWRLGLKTGQYYLRTEAITMSRKQLAIEAKTENEDLPKKPENSQFECFGCSA